MNIELGKKLNALFVKQIYPSKDTNRFLKIFGNESLKQFLAEGRIDPKKRVKESHRPRIDGLDGFLNISKCQGNRVFPVSKIDHGLGAVTAAKRTAARKA